VRDGEEDQRGRDEGEEGVADRRGVVTESGRAGVVAAGDPENARALTAGRRTAALTCVHLLTIILDSVLDARSRCTLDFQHAATLSVELGSRPTPVGIVLPHTAARVTLDLGGAGRLLDDDQQQERRDEDQRGIHFLSFCFCRFSLRI